MSDKPVRLDAWLVTQGMAQSRQRAQELIKSGQVLVNGIPATKPSRQVRRTQSVKLKAEDFPWVSRGALKLLGVLDPLGVETQGWTAADLGSSTGGFTEVLLSKGVVRVYAIDVGRGQLHRRLVTDERVVVMEGVNARHLDSLPEPIDLIVGDLSFISLKLILPTVMRLLRPAGQAVILVKPQFEAGKAQIAKGGRVRDEQARTDAIDAVRTEAAELGFEVVGGMDCPVAGAKAGNVEYFLHLRRP